MKDFQTISALHIFFHFPFFMIYFFFIYISFIFVTYSYATLCHISMLNSYVYIYVSFHISNTFLMIDIHVAFIFFYISTLCMVKL